MITKLIGWIILGALVLGVGIWSVLNRQFYKESLQELQKVTWPTKDEALSYAMVTIGFIVVFSLFLAVVDYAVSVVMLKLVG